MQTLILSPASTRDNLHLEAAAKQIGFQVYRARQWVVPTDLPNPTVFGPVHFCDVIAGQLGLGLLETHDEWLPSLPDEYLQRQVLCMTHAHLGFVHDRRFIKPANDKVFQAGIFECGAHVPHRQILPSAPVLVSEVVDFEAEVRCYIRDRQVCAASIYAGLTHGSSPDLEAKITAEAKEWTQRFLDDPEVALPDAIVVDVGFIPDRGWAVIEANQAWASGVYVGGYNSKEGTGADPVEVLRVIAQSTPRLSDADPRWLRPLSV